MGDIGCYILKSQKLNRYYIGACHDNLNNRILKHNNKSYGNKAFTTIADDWVLILFLRTEDYPHAIRLERKIKQMKSRVYIENLLKYPELVNKILNETKRS